MLSSMRAPRHAEIWTLAALAGLGAFAWALVRGAGPEAAGRAGNTPVARTDPPPSDPDDLESWLRRNPSRADQWLRLGNTRADQGRTDDAHAAWLKSESLYEGLAERGFASYPFPSHGWYDLACVRARLAKPEEALAALEKAVDAGWGNADHAITDADLELIRSDPRFDALVARMRRHPRVFNAG